MSPVSMRFDFAYDALKPISAFAEAMFPSTYQINRMDEMLFLIRTPN